MASDDRLDRATLVAQWEVAFGHPPPLYLSIPFMTKALAYQAQCKRAGGLPAQTRHTLQRIAAGRTSDVMPLNPSRIGTLYVREWNGRTYQVEAVEGGYQLDGRVWPSLSAIAKHITGTTWSGPRFFGLAKVRSAAA